MSAPAACSAAVAPAALTALCTPGTLSADLHRRAVRGREPERCPARVGLESGDVPVGTVGDAEPLHRRSPPGGRRRRRGLPRPPAGTVLTQSVNSCAHLLQRSKRGVVIQIQVGDHRDRGPQAARSCGRTHRPRQPAGRRRRARRFRRAGAPRRRSGRWDRTRAAAPRRRSSPRWSSCRGPRRRRSNGGPPPSRRAEPPVAGSSASSPGPPRARRRRRRSPTRRPPPCRDADARGRVPRDTGIPNRSTRSEYVDRARSHPDTCAPHA